MRLWTLGQAAAMESLALRAPAQVCVSSALSAASMSVHRGVIGGPEPQSNAFSHAALLAGAPACLRNASDVAIDFTAGTPKAHLASSLFPSGPAMNNRYC